MEEPCWTWIDAARSREQLDQLMAQATLLENKLDQLIAQVSALEAQIQRDSIRRRNENLRKHVPFPFVPDHS